MGLKNQLVFYMCPFKKKSAKQTNLPHIWKVPVECVPFRFTSYPFFQKHPRKGDLAFEPLSYPTFLLLSDLPSFFSSQDPLKVSTKRWGFFNHKCPLKFYLT